MLKPTLSHLRGLACIFFAIAILPGPTVAAADRNWQTGTVVGFERQEVPQGSTITTNTDGRAKNQNNGVRYSENSTTTVTNDTDTYQVYTIQAQGTTYVVSEKLNFPWSKPTSVTVGGTVKYSVSGHKMFLMGDDGKEHKATIVRASAGAQ